MSARRERPPSGKVIRSETLPSARKAVTPGPISNIQYETEKAILSGRMSARESSQNDRARSASANLSNRRPATSSSARSPNYFTESGDFLLPKADTNYNTQGPEVNSGRSTGTELSTNELLRRMREKSDVVKHAADQAAIDALGPYNYFSRPRSSTEVPLRTVFLDAEVNNFPRSKTRSELMRKIKASGVPHPSYDLDVDGYVSQHDYRLAKRFDFDGNGVLDPDERHVGKQILADEFFKRHQDHVYMFGPTYVDNSHKQNVTKLVNSYSFERSYDKLQQVERKLGGSGSAPILQCLRSSVSQDILKHNFYSDKMDTTAWNDLDAIPRSASQLGIASHGGSRKKFLFARTNTMRQEMEHNIATKPYKTYLPVQNVRRVNMITDVKFENS